MWSCTTYFLRFLKKIYFDVRTYVAIGGFLLSIIFHELFHILMHIGYIESISFFTDKYTIVQIKSAMPVPYDVSVEEGFAYAISSVVILLTILLIGELSAQRDTRSLADTLLNGRSRAEFAGTDLSNIIATVLR